jgi:hypothetical protein
VRLEPADSRIAARAGDLGVEEVLELARARRLASGRIARQEDELAAASVVNGMQYGGRGQHSRAYCTGRDGGVRAIVWRLYHPRLETSIYLPSTHGVYAAMMKFRGQREPRQRPRRGRKLPPATLLSVHLPIAPAPSAVAILHILQVLRMPRSSLPLSFLASLTFSQSPVADCKQPVCPLLCPHHKLITLT